MLGGMDRDMPRLTLTLPAQLLDAVRERAGRGGVSSWIAQAAADRLGREQLAAAIADYQAEAGPLTSDDLAKALERTTWRPAAERRSSPAA